MKTIHPLLLLLLLMISSCLYGQDVPLSHTQDTTYRIVRTDKKIIPIERFHAPYTIQVSIMKSEPSTPFVFDKADHVLLVKGADGWNRYYVGQYRDRSEAQQMLTLLKPIYPDAFLCMTDGIRIDSGRYVRTYVRKAEIRSAASTEEGQRTQRKAEAGWNFGPLPSDSMIECPYQTQGAVAADPRQSYAVQLLVTRYPLHANDIIEFRNVQEYFMPADHLFRYTTQAMPYAEAEKALQKALRAGFFDAVLIDSRIYAPFLVL
ncbi:MAG: SPOR domain-containing protein [Paludibacteraceae bacterium]|nr:SPOR domain-containing protein [Paludibacteraceae bacterium]